VVIPEVLPSSDEDDFTQVLHICLLQCRLIVRTWGLGHGTSRSASAQAHKQTSRQGAEASPTGPVVVTGTTKDQESRAGTSSSSQHLTASPDRVRRALVSYTGSSSPGPPPFWRLLLDCFSPANVSSTSCRLALPMSGSGQRDAVEAIGRVYCPIAWLPPGHDPGAGGGVATTAQQRGLFGLGTFWFDDAASGSRRRIAVVA
jgi:hypothetical protein